jgi:hypothetical protein
LWPQHRATLLGQGVVKLTFPLAQLLPHVEYWHIDQGQRWAVFDVIVDGVSLALNYRAQFGQIIQRSSYDTLLHRIKSKAEEGSS